MNHNLIVSQSIDVNASPARVWEAMTNPDLIKQYLFGTETITDWKVGSEIIFQGEWEGTRYKDKGIIKEIIPGKKIVYTYWSGFSGLEDIPGNYSLVTCSLEPKNEKLTSFTWTYKGFKDEEGYNHSRNGMTQFLETVKKVMEQGA